MRDRLIELLKESKYGDWNWLVDDIRIDDFADYLLDNGVIVPPCKVGDKVYWISPKHKIRKLELISICIGVSETEYGCYGGNYTPVCFYESDIGKTVFLTREEAERALKESEVKKDE